MSLSHWARRQKWLWKSDCSEAKKRKTTKVYSAIITGGAQWKTLRTHLLLEMAAYTMPKLKRKGLKSLDNRISQSLLLLLFVITYSIIAKKVLCSDAFSFLEFQCGKWEFLQIEGDLATGKDRISTNGWDFIPKLIHLHFSSIRRNFDQSEFDLEISIAQLGTPSCKCSFRKQ